jgi:hypothetical protein
MDTMEPIGEMPQDQGLMDAVMGGMACCDENKRANSEDDEISEATRKLVTKWCSRIQKAKTYWDPKFKQMQKDMQFARGKQWEDNDDAYVANIVGRQIGARTSAIYAKNPRFTARRRPRLDFRLWDGSPDTLQAALANPLAPGATELLADISEGKKTRELYDRIGQTMEILMQYFLNEGNPRFKLQAKQLIRRVRTCGVGYIEVGWQRIMKPSPSADGQLSDMSNRLAHIERQVHELKEGEIQTDSAEAEELRTAINALQSQEQVILREGLTFDFPRARHMIIDPEVTQLRGFIGARWLAREYLMPHDRVEERFNVDLKTAYTKHTATTSNPTGTELACVWRVFDLENGTEFYLCDGYKGFLQDPAEPDAFYEQGHPWLALTFNDVEDEDDCFCPSDVEILRPMQLEINRAREAVRQHRIANRPAWVGAKGLFTNEDKFRMAAHEINEFIELDSIPASGDVDIRTKIQAKPVAPIDPATYETETVFVDILRTMGEQEANLGGTSGATATESSIAEGSRMSAVSSNVDDLDEFLSDVARMSGQLLLHELSVEWAQRIAGPGAVWPDLSREEIANEIFLEVRAGSSGRPNRAMKLANIERIAPFVLQTPGLNPLWWLRNMLEEMDDGLDIDDAIMANLPSIIAMNAQKQVSTGNPASDPSQQGVAGAQNGPVMNTAGGPQAPMPQGQAPTY